MEVMEEGNLMDRIPILLQRDMEYYEVCKFRSRCRCIIASQFLTAKSSGVAGNDLQWDCWWSVGFSPLCFICFGEDCAVVGRRIFCSLQSSLGPAGFVRNQRRRWRPRWWCKFVWLRRYRKIFWSRAICVSDYKICWQLTWAYSHPVARSVGSRWLVGANSDHWCCSFD